MVSISLALPVFIAAEAGLSYLGIGVQGASWGQTIDSATKYWETYPLFLWEPVIGIALLSSRSTCSATRFATQSTRRPGAERPHTSATRSAWLRKTRKAPHMKRKKAFVAAASVAALTLGLAACGGSSDNGSSSELLE